MRKIEILQQINLGNSIAEYDDNISNYFITTNSALDLINDRYDIVKGVKGSGKTAMLVSICANQHDYKQLNGKYLIQAIQIKGDPDFNRAFKTVSIKTADTQKLVDAWKIYLINIIWKKCNELFNEYYELESYLKKENIISDKKSVLDNLIHAFKRTKLKFTNTFSPDGKTTQSLELSPDHLSESSDSKSITDLIDYNYILNELNSIIENNSSCFWIMLDRLDDAFPDNTSTDTLVLKSLFYAYKDLCVYSGFKIKIFIRDDIFNSITLDKGFTSLSHVSSKTMKSIKWERDIIEQLIVERLLYNQCFSDYILSFGYKTDCSKLTPNERVNILFKFLKSQIDVGVNNPDSIGWIINHVKDGNGVYTPRDIIDLLDKARSIQLDQLNEKNLKDISEDYLIGAGAIREAYVQISVNKLEVQLYAEYPKYRKLIESFRDQKAEHDASSLQIILGPRWKSNVEKLKKIGFIEEKKNTWKIPFLYRGALHIIQGKAK